jgi:hypothetical protein
MTTNRFTTSEVAIRLGIPRQHIYSILYHHPQLRPALKLSAGALLWTEEEMTLLIEHRNAAKNRQHTRSVAQA